MASSFTNVSETHLPNDSSDQHSKTSKSKARTRGKDPLSIKRRCVSTACVACRRRKSKCDGNQPSCAACASVYGTECVYDPNSDHRRKGVYKKDIDNLKTRNSTLQTLVQGILNYPEDEVNDLVKLIRTCESLDEVAETILIREARLAEEEEEAEAALQAQPHAGNRSFETELSGKLGQLRLENGSIHFIGGTSNLVHLDSESHLVDFENPAISEKQYQNQQDAAVSWTTVTSDSGLVMHLLNMYFTWHYTYFTTLSKTAFLKSFRKGKPAQETRRPGEYCTSLLVNIMLALGCHFTSWPAARSDPSDSSTAGDHFFREAKRIMHEQNEYETPSLPTVQALALMSVREAGCGREARGWVYSGMSFRMAQDLGLNVDTSNMAFDEEESDARRITLWGCFLFDKCWSNYLGRPPQLPLSNITIPMPDVFPAEEAESWAPWTDNGSDRVHSQPARTRTVARQISALCEISNDLLLGFYHPSNVEKPMGKQAELKKLSDLHTRLETWKKNLPKEMEAKEGQLPSVLVMHMFFQLLFIHLFRPFLKYTAVTSPLPAHVSARKLCTQAAATISKLLRLYKRTYGLRQICNICVYIAHSACTIHLLNLPDKDARRDITHGIKHLAEISEGWLCARRTLAILSIQIRKWNIELPEEASTVLEQMEAKYPNLRTTEHPSPSSFTHLSPVLSQQAPLQQPPTCIPNMLEAKNQILESPPITNASPTGQEYLASEPQYNASFPQVDYVITDDQLGKATYNTPPSQPVTSTNQNRNHSISRMFGGIDSLFEESRDWWLKDQSVYYNNWTRPEIGPSIMSNGADSQYNVNNSRCSIEEDAVAGNVLDYMVFRGTPQPQPQLSQQHLHQQQQQQQQRETSDSYGGFDSENLY